ncbi:MAG: hypothetical protein GY804_03185 [Alphaproteobacteria bacterium]|nr:hypothetical protein [Alphaproteobacteria bacterium]
MKFYTKRSICKLVSAFFCIASIAGCSSNNMPPYGLHSGVAFAGLETVMLINTDKTLSDHLISSYTNKDCSSVRYSEGGEYCVDTVEIPSAMYEKLFCYRTIGEVSCYDRPIPGYRRVDM